MRRRKRCGEEAHPLRARAAGPSEQAFLIELFASGGGRQPTPRSKKLVLHVHPVLGLLALFCLLHPL